MSVWCSLALQCQAAPQQDTVEAVGLVRTGPVVSGTDLGVLDMSRHQECMKEGRLPPATFTWVKIQIREAGLVRYEYRVWSPCG